jgi:hypothetical protein
MPRYRPALVVTLAVATAALGVAPAADASAASARCKALGGKTAKVVATSKGALVLSRGSFNKLTLTYYGCLYAKKPRLYKLPEQNGGDTEFFGKFTFAGRYLAYTHGNEENAAVVSPSWVELADLKGRKHISKYDTFPGESSNHVTQILLKTDGALAWIGEAFTNDGTKRIVQTALAGQATAAEVDRDPKISNKSLRLVTGDSASFTWLRSGTLQTAAFGGPTATPQG